MIQLIILTCLPILLFPQVLSQYTGSNLHYQPARLVFAKQEWFQGLLDDNAIHRLPQMLIRNTNQDKCDRACWESEYDYSYFQNSSKNCLCSMREYTYAHNVIGSPVEPLDNNFDTSARFTYLNADFTTLNCTDRTDGPSFRTSLVAKIEDCIANCGNPSGSRPRVYSFATPGSYQEGPDYFVYEYKCDCYSRYTFGGDGICAWGKMHVYGRFM